MALTKYTEYQIITYKDIQALLITSERTAKQYLTDIKNELQLKKVLYIHFKKYFKV